MIWLWSIDYEYLLGTGGAPAALIASSNSNSFYSKSAWPLHANGDNKRTSVYLAVALVHRL